MFEGTKQKLREPVERATKIAIAALFVALLAFAVAVSK